MAAESVVLAVCVHYHRHGVPANGAFDADFGLPIAWKRRLLIGRNRIDVGRADRRRDPEARGAEPVQHVVREERRLLMGLGRERVLQHMLQGLEPLFPFAVGRSRGPLGAVMQFRFHF